MSFSRAGRYLITDEQLFHRLVRVLRLRESDSLILFNQQYHALVILEKITAPQSISVILQGSVLSNTVYQPTMCLYLPLLKKEALEEAIYSAVEVGIQHIKLYHAHKAHIKAVDSTLERRIQMQAIAAAEQSKNYAAARIEMPISFDAMVQQVAQYDQFFVCDPAGMCAGDAWASLQSKKRYAFLVGPEGGLTDDELHALVALGVQSVALTPTILRAPQAVAVGGGMFRSLMPS